MLSEREARELGLTVKKAGARAKKLRSERGFQDTFIEFAKYKGWRRLHILPAMRRGGSYVTSVQGDGVGFPDNLLLRGNRQVVAELKSKYGTVTYQQALWLNDFKKVGAEVYVWTPEDWDEIERVLA